MDVGVQDAAECANARASAACSAQRYKRSCDGGLLNWWELSQRYFIRLPFSASSRTVAGRVVFVEAVEVGDCSGGAAHCKAVIGFHFDWEMVYRTCSHPQNGHPVQLNT